MKRLKLHFYSFCVIVTSILLSCCGSSHIPKPILGMPIYQCPQTQSRTVVCHTSLSEHDCEILEQAVDYINYASGFTFFVYSGREIKSELDLVFGYTKDTHAVDMSLEHQPAMVTGIEFDLKSGCIEQERTVVLLYTDHFSEASLESLFRHELAHALGMPHEIEGFTGLMQLGFNPDMITPMPFSFREIRLLKTVYPWILPPSLFR